MVRGLTISTVWLVVGLVVVPPAQAQSDPGTLVREANEQILNKGNLDVIGELFSDDYVNHSSPDQRGPQFIREFVTALKTAFPDLHVEVEILLQEGDRVAWKRTHEGTFEADLFGVEATGQKVVWHSVAISRVAAGQIVEEWGLSDLRDQVQD